MGKIVLELISLNYSDVLCAGAGHSLELAKEQTIENGNYIVVYEGAITQGFNSNTLRVALETGEDILVDTSSKAVRRAHHEWWIQYQGWLKTVFTKSGVDSVSVRTDEDFVKALLNLFKKRA